MRREQKIRLMKKFRVREVSGGVWGDGFFEGLSCAENYKERPEVSEKDRLKSLADLRIQILRRSTK